MADAGPSAAGGGGGGASVGLVTRPRSSPMMSTGLQRVSVDERLDEDLVSGEPEVRCIWYQRSNTHNHLMALCPGLPG